MLPYIAPPSLLERSISRKFVFPEDLHCSSNALECRIFTLTVPGSAICWPYGEISTAVISLFVGLYNFQTRNSLVMKDESNEK